MINKSVTERQAILILVCCVLATKFQRLPSLMAERFGRDCWIILSIMLVVDILFLLLILKFFEYSKGKNFYELVEANMGKFTAKLFAIIFSVYYCFKALLSFKSTHEFFANTLFDKLPWSYFSILLVVLLIFMTTKGLRSIGRSAELYIYLILGSLVFAMLLGFFSADFSRILPILNNDFTKMLGEAVKYYLWFADYMFLLFLIGKVKKSGKFKRNIILTYVITGVFIIAFYLIFYCVNDNMSQYQINALTSITQHSLLGLGVGRPDWFLVLFVFIATIISTGFFSWIICFSVSYLFGKENNYIFSTIVIIGIYVLDVFVFKNLRLIIDISTNYVSYFTITTNLIVPISLCIACVMKNKKRKKEKKSDDKVCA